jgi:hypothetical protein
MPRRAPPPPRLPEAFVGGAGDEHFATCFNAHSRTAASVLPGDRAMLRAYVRVPRECRPPAPKPWLIQDGAAASAAAAARAAPATPARGRDGAAAPSCDAGAEAGAAARRSGLPAASPVPCRAAARPAPYPTPWRLEQPQPQQPPPPPPVPAFAAAEFFLLLDCGSAMRALWPEVEAGANDFLAALRGFAPPGARCRVQLFAHEARTVYDGAAAEAPPLPACEPWGRYGGTPKALHGPSAPLDALAQAMRAAPRKPRIVLLLSGARRAPRRARLRAPGAARAPKPRPRADRSPRAAQAAPTSWSWSTTRRWRARSWRRTRRAARSLCTWARGTTRSARRTRSACRALRRCASRPAWRAPPATRRRTRCATRCGAPAASPSATTSACLRAQRARTPGRSAAEPRPARLGARGTHALDDDA